MFKNMKSVMVFDPKDTDNETATKFMNWKRDNSAIGDKAVPDAKKTQKYLRRYKKENVI